MELGHLFSFIGFWVAPATLGPRREWGCKRKEKSAKDALPLAEGHAERETVKARISSIYFY